ncbi:MAG: hypothetical protein MHPDNHAH_03066 [Anaerolineales bacterium]|nr:hypothetical protein [Anaerolineales bacterium]
MTASMETKPTNSFARLWAYLTAPHPSVRDVGERRRAQLLASLTLILTFTLILAILATLSSSQIFFIFLSVTFISYFLSRTPSYRAGTYFFTIALTSLAYITIYFGAANTIDSAISSTVTISLILASALLSQRGFAILALITIFATASLPAYANPKYLSDPDLSLGRTFGITMSMSLILLGIMAFRASVEKERVQQLGNTNRELEKLTGELEQRVEERTRELNLANKTTSHRAAQLQTIAELSQAISQVHDPNQIFSAASQLISEQFGFYHVGIFLIDHDREYAVLHAANSAGGQKMLERGHRLALGTGVVGFAAQTGKPRLALDVGADAIYFNNPDLPKTRSEIALPLLYSEQTIGVLDVQSTEPGAFSEDDFRLLGTLANQLAIAIENARLLSEARAAARQVEEVYNEFVRAQWGQTSQRANYTGFRYNAGRIEMLEPNADGGVSVAPEGGPNSLNADQVDPSSANRERITVPVKLRGAVIGMLQVESNDTSKTWQPDERSLMEAVAERAALALENARLFQDARRRAAKERMIAEATSNISSSLNIENILQATATELERVLGGSEVLIRFNSEDSA